MRLNQYHKKRDFSKTPEPKGKITQEKPRLFVIQKHDASHLHYDFRIELDGVLKSWAIPKGPSLDPKVKRLAIHVEDHPIEYGSFEGIIPKGQYGGGTVMLWDKGTWEPLDENPSQAYEKGHLRFELHAEKLNGRWDLIRFKDEKNWFLIKHQDKYAQEQSSYDLTKELDKSVLTHQTIEELATYYNSVWNSKELKKQTFLLPKGLVKSPFPDFFTPQLATLVDKASEGEQWLHEIKFDGYRILAFKKGDDVILKSRTNQDWTDNLEVIADAIKALSKKNIILDGEVVLLDKQGKSDFQLLQNSIKGKQDAPYIYFLFDILYYEHYDLRKLPLLERKKILKNLLNKKSPTLHYSDHIINNGQEVFEHSCAHALEGIISKRIDSTYSSKRSKDWLKIKCTKRQEFVIGGYTSPQGKREYFGALLLGYFNKEGQLEYVGNVGTGFSNASLKEIYQLLVAHESQSNPFSTEPSSTSLIHWVHPKLVGEIEFSEWTKENHLRHPSFKGLRLDKKASEIQREKETPLKQIKTQKPLSKKLKTRFVLSHPTKILYPEDHITKEDLLIYYDTVSDYILPFLSLRPLTLVRCPSNYEHCFYQRHFNKTTPKALYPIDVKNDEGTEQYIYLKDKEGLLSLVQMGVLEIHPWGSQITHLEQPDIIVIDLDPAPDVAWSKVVSNAIEIRDYLAQYQLRSFVKSTGGKGLHVVIPIKPEYDWEDVKEFTHVFVQFLEQLKPDEYISTMSKSKRGGKIFVDYLRNQRTATAIGTYSTRARLHAPVSTPLAWEELSNRIEDNTYTIKTLHQRLSELKVEPWGDFWSVKQSLRLDKL